MLEDQFRRYFEAAERTRGITGVTLLQLLERRLDNVVYRLGLAASRREARQLVSHRHFQLNGRIINVASAQVRPGDVVEVRERSRKLPPIINARELVAWRTVPDWLTLDASAMRGTVVRLPERHEMEQTIDEQLVVEFYSR